MANISASMVKDLRDKTGAGMMDCKAALNETGGDLEAATDWLRTKGLAKAAKKAGRVAADGLVGLATTPKTETPKAAALVEVNSETDFVARNDTFKTLVANIAEAALKSGGDLAKLEAAKYPGGSGTVAATLKQTVCSIGENLVLRRSASLSVPKGLVASYVHNAVGDGLGKIGVIVALETEGDPAKIADLGRKIAMHIAHANPQAIDTADLDPKAVERERAVLAEQAKESGKPDAVIEKMVEGRLRKFYEEVVLLSQAFIFEPEISVGKAMGAAEKAAGAPIKVTGFYRYALGEGIDRSEDETAS
jgi:elongation factor Ts